MTPADAAAWLQSLKAGDPVALEQRTASWGPTFLVRAEVVKVTPTQLVLRAQGRHADTRAHRRTGVLLGGWSRAVFPLTAEVEASIRERGDRDRLHNALRRFNADTASIETVRAILPYLTCTTEKASTNG